MKPCLEIEGKYIIYMYIFNCISAGYQANIHMENENQNALRGHRNGEDKVIQELFWLVLFAHLMRN